jgi:hypothetical protein
MAMTATIVEYEGLESSVLGSQRVARGVIQLTRRPVRREESSPAAMRTTASSASKPRLNTGSMAAPM